MAENTLYEFVSCNALNFKNNISKLFCLLKNLGSALQFQHLLRVVSAAVTATVGLWNQSCVKFDLWVFLPW
jgi:hypothetical protein